ncbi:antibiotic biosynthesis monooxygenase family protein, partial [Candidatus Protofrankia californiensis]|uniref:antibiotic biosynthesis monooxygenase family protein n=1 Tax=Candidatus Protofrankia californiensis TaxID=1839754 RepID=UPI001F49F147
LTAALRDLRDDAERHTYDVLHTLEGRGSAVRVLVTTTVPADEEEAFEQAFLDVAEAMHGVAGRIREELLHEPGTRTFHLLAEWTSEKAFLAWVGDPHHSDRTSQLIPFLDRGFSRRIFSIVARPPEAEMNADTNPDTNPDTSIGANARSDQGTALEQHPAGALTTTIRPEVAGARR